MFLLSRPPRPQTTDPGDVRVAMQANIILPVPGRTGVQYNTREDNDRSVRDTDRNEIFSAARTTVATAVAAIAAVTTAAATKPREARA